MTKNMTPEMASLERSLTNISPSEDQIDRIEMLREFAKAYGNAVLQLSLHSRERSLAVTKLEESVMWAVKGIVLNESTPTTFGDEG